MDWKQLPVYISGSVEEEPLLRMEYLVAAVLICLWNPAFPSRPCLYRFRSMAPDAGCPRLFVW